MPCRSVYLVTRPIEASASTFENGRSRSSRSSSGRTRARDDPLPESHFSDLYNHWAVNIGGDYHSELFTDDNGNIEHSWTEWDQDQLNNRVSRSYAGMTNFDDYDISDAADSVIERMRSEGKYHMTLNNCQEFAKRLVKIIIADGSSNWQSTMRGKNNEKSSVKGTVWHAVEGLAYEGMRAWAFGPRKGGGVNSAGRQLFRQVMRPFREDHLGY